MHGVGYRENAYLSQLHTERGRTPQARFELAADLIQGSIEKARRKEGQVAAGGASRFNFLAKPFNKTSQRLRNVSYQGEGIYSGSLSAKRIHTLLDYTASLAQGR